MTSLFERLDQEEAVVRGELAALREKIAVAEERLAHLTITRETLLSLVVEEYADQNDDVTQDAPEAPADEPVADDSAPDSQPDEAEVPSSGAASAGPLEWEEARERMLVLLAGAGRAMKVQDIAAAIGEDVSDTSKGRRVETTRSRLKRLVKEGRVVEGPTAWFAIAPTSAGEQRQGDARE
ncbi:MULTISPECIES: hypothetical protein [Streptomyces]|uniref:MarR family transcriptional regulator n=1 Tax=Streptomyces silvae TaxID=2803812 RepID=A0ABU7ZW77_9ACTN|nr:MULTISPECIES: hypothetical protein [unclassified Streptomyces]MDX3326931.1 hypothetical protein [Streptomyces sp. ME02-6979-3A]MDX3433542.1 hypothetical protein [Streptomyces sp. ME01-18a]MDX3688532.1 hypothetical protein [Streptomyces sp. AK04-4c]